MPTINGKGVTFYKRFPARDNWDLPQQLNAVAIQAEGGEIDLKATVPVLQRVIQAWEFGGDPAEAEDYGDLDIFSELIPLLTAAAEYIGELTSQGESASAST